MKSLPELAQQSLWGITPDMLKVIDAILQDHAEGLRLDSAEIQSRLGHKLENTYSVRVQDGVAIIPVHGVLAKRMNLFAMISGGTSTEILMSDFQDALGNDEVQSILLDIDSPGGTVDGTQALAGLIYQSRGEKPVIAFANGLMASAAYWVGSAADQIIAEETAAVGSVGVISMHYDYSEADRKEGVKRTVISSGKYKAIGNDTEPLSKEGEQYIKDRLDYLYSIFVNEVARNRGVDTKAALNMSEGKIFIGQQAMDVGLVDQIGSFDDAFNIAKDGEKGGKDKINANSNQSKGGEQDMNLEEMKKKDPEGFAALMKEAEGNVTSDLTIKFDTEKTELETKHQAEKAELQGEIKNKDEQAEALEKRTLALEKKDVIREEETLEKGRTDAAEKIWTEKLSASDIPEHLHEKVKKQVSFAGLVKDGKLDEEAFSAAVDAEIEDGWPVASSVQGTGAAFKEVDGAAQTREKEEKEEDDLVDSMVSLAQNPIDKEKS